MLNRVELIGNLGQGVDIRYMPNGNPVASISLATSRRWKDKQTGEKREASEWHRVIFFNRLAEIAGEYLGKGDKIYVSGRLQTRQWEKDGQKHYTTEIIATDLLMLETNKSNGDHYAPANSSRQSARNNQPDTRPAPPTPPMQNYDDFDDDIPF